MRVINIGGTRGDSTLTVPQSRKPLRIFTLSFQLVTGPTVASRIPLVTLSTGDLIVMRFAATDAQAANITRQWLFAAGGLSSIAVDGLTIQQPLPTRGIFVTSELRAVLSVTAGLPEDAISGFVAQAEDLEGATTRQP